MPTTIHKLCRAARRRLQKIIQKDKGPASRRAQGVLRVSEGETVAAVARSMSAGRSSIYRWVGWYQLEGEAGLHKHQEGNTTPRSVNDEVVQTLLELIESEPGEADYLRSRWTSEMLAQAMHERMGMDLHASTIRRLLPLHGYGWRRSRPTLCIKDHKKAEKMAAINAVLDKPKARTEVFYVDEADIALNPRIGFGWQRRGQQQTIPTPGQNQKRYLAGALHARTGAVVFVEGERKNSDLFVALLEQIKSTYRGARRIVLILDNYRIHKSRRTQQWLAQQGQKFTFLFQPIYHPWVNRIERLWKALHDTVTRNHRYASMNALLAAVRRFMLVVQPFPGAGQALAKVA